MVKVSKPDQDMRFDVPVIGVETVADGGRSAGARHRGGSGIALFSSKKMSSRELAARAGISIVGR